VVERNAAASSILHREVDTVGHGAEDLNGAKLVGSHLVRVLGEDGKVGQLADLNRADALLTVAGVRGVDGDQTQGGLHVHAFVRAQHLATESHTAYSVLHVLEWAGKGDWRIAVDGDRNAKLLR
jgi:hypothetical protein